MKICTQGARLACMIWIVAVTMLTGCGTSNLAEPTITNRTFPWVGQVDRIFTADVNVPSGWSVVAVYVRFTRHFWPGPAAANEVVATSPAAGIFNAAPAGAAAFPTSHTVFYEWFVDYKLAAGGTEILTARSGLRQLVVGCTPAQTRNDLIGAAGILRSRFNTPVPHIALQPLGYVLLPHFNVSLAGAGVGFAAVQAGISLTTADLSNPDLVLYRPRPANPGETGAQHFAAITDPVFSDPPYTVIGGAYGALYDPAARPILGCIPSHEWFVHEAGYHLANGNMILTPPNDNGVPGSANMTTPPAAPPPGAWHPRFWDLHLWLSADGNPVPTMAIDHPAGVAGIALPAGTFFRPQTFE